MKQNLFAMKSKLSTENGKKFLTTRNADIANRAGAEEEHSKKLLKLSKMPLGTKEIGSLKSSLLAVKTEVEGMGNAHAEVATSMRRELEEALGGMAGRMKELRKMV